MKTRLISRNIRSLGVLIVAVALASLLMSACGGHSATSGQSDLYLKRQVAAENVESLLKFDSRVDEFNTDGGVLMVHVNQYWVDSPQGIQQYALGQWFKAWQEGQGSEVVVRHNGEDLARATGQGIEFIQKASEEKAEEES
jgi:hypothetical protein